MVLVKLFYYDLYLMFLIVKHLKRVMIKWIQFYYF